MEDIIYTTILSFGLAIPPMSLIFSIAPVAFFTKNKRIFRTEFQSKILIYATISISTHIAAKILGATAAYSELSRLLLNFLAQTIPAILYAACVYLASKRLNSMGYNRFWSLLSTLPALGPAMLLWIALSIREKQT